MLCCRPACPRLQSPSGPAQPQWIAQLAKLLRTTETGNTSTVNIPSIKKIYIKKKNKWCPWIDGQDERQASRTTTVTLAGPGPHAPMPCRMLVPVPVPVPKAPLTN
ncbi:hypothetical protein BDDG_03757 [Blastomyces dermatitidis ATCC 18188]|uniref:Uncharacterized protein n=1 Tax=Ajellomyces dermatitidis (strain ATCC 18188 / CBS 674.68) TaxID=653446 RepID=F2TC53_AJEDA|nr:hypothetical protein BDDG_03757 [Blastomyces dermatitidis ATCC 18188]